MKIFFFSFFLQDRESGTYSQLFHTRCLEVIHDFVSTIQFITSAKKVMPLI